MVWRWFRVDVPVRVLPLILIPLIWAIFWEGGVEAVGLTTHIQPQWWIPILLMAIVVFFVCVVFITKRGGVGSRPTAGALGLELPFYLILNPIAEELFFRGLLQRQVAEVIGLLPALLLVSVLFGFHHVLAGFKRPFLILATIGGLLFGAVMVACNSVLPSIALHVVADIGMFLVGPWWVSRSTMVVEHSA